MSQPHIVECVPNFSEGRDSSIIDSLVRSIEAVPQVAVLHRTSLPFVPLDTTPMEVCVDLAHRAGHRIASEVGLPVYFYEAAALQPSRIRLEQVRRGQFEGVRDEVLVNEERRPDLGGPALHPTAGAVIIGARRFLIAFNINLQSDDLALAKDIARQIRESSGGFPAVKALGLALPTRGLVQVSMNLTDFDRTSLFAVFDAVSRLAAERGVSVVESELIGLLPRRALEQSAAQFLKLPDFSADRIIESRLDAVLRAE
jgi:glutamate formiminotransferase